MQKSTSINDLALYQDYKAGIKILNNEDMQHIRNLFQNKIKKVEDLKENPLKLAVIGEFSVGKSAFLSKLLDKEGLLPEKIVPSTAFITEFYYDEKEYFEVVYENNLGDIYLEKVEDLSKLKDDEYKQNHTGNKHLPQIKKIKVYLKNPILKTFCLLDTPGLNDSNNEMSEITEEIFDEIDYAIWIFDANKAGNDTEKESIQNLYNKIGKSIYFLINKADGKDENSIKQITDRLEEYKKEFSTQEEIYAISATSKEKEYIHKFKFLKDNLKQKILQKDQQLSVAKIRQEIEDFLSILKNIKGSYSESLDGMLFILDEYKSKKVEPLEIDIPIEQEIKTLILKQLENLYSKIKESDIYKDNSNSELLQFYCYHTTLEVLRDIQERIDEIYTKYMNNLLEENEIFSKKLKEALTTSVLQPNNLYQEIEIILSNIKSNIETSKERKILNIKGYIVGLLTDDYIYKLIKSEKDNVKSLLNEDIIKMLIGKDIDLSFIDVKIENLEQLISGTKNNDLAVLYKLNCELKKSINIEEVEDATV
jgi:signal recognition particle receptor subunit beta